jgi:NAD(P)-dependent dehydrogenase (short-subunit alcohol dehydrogenase family)
MTKTTSAPRRVLITGGTKGIGFQIVRAFANEGDRVLTTSRKLSDDQQQALAELRVAHVCSDVREAESIEQLFSAADAQLGGVDVVVHNAGGSPFAYHDAASPRFIEGVLKLNLLSPMLIAQAAYRAFQRANSRGTLILIGSVAACRPSPGTAVYGAAKAGVVHLAQSLAVEWGSRARVVCISPGLIETEQAELHYGDRNGVMAVQESIPAGRMGRPQDVASACLFAASGAADYWSGTNLLLHGGGEWPGFLTALKTPKP